MSTPNNSIDPKLMASLGIKPSQIDTTKVSTRAIKEITTKTELLKDEARKSIALVNSVNGEDVRFTALQRDGKTKQGEPKYKQVNLKGHWVVEKTSDGLFTASKCHYYTETFKIADFTYQGKNSDLKQLDKVLK